MGLFLFPLVFIVIYLFMITNDQITLYSRYCVDSIYAIESLFKIQDMNREIIPLVLTYNQKNLLNGIYNYRFNVVKKGRFLGSDTALAAWVAIKMTFQYNSDEPDAIVYCSNMIDNSYDFISKVKFFLDQVPDWVWPGFDSRYKRQTRNEIVLVNDCRVKALSTSRDGLCGYGFNHFIMDDAASMPNGRDMFSMAITSLGTGGSATVVSVPNGFDSFFEPLYYQAERMMSQFNNVNMHWAYDPRFNEEMFWEKDGYCVHEHEFTKKSISHKLNFDWKPYSKWSVNMAHEYLNSEAYARQELNGEFVDSPRR